MSLDTEAELGFAIVFIAGDFCSKALPILTKVHTLLSDFSSYRSCCWVTGNPE